MIEQIKPLFSTNEATAVYNLIISGSWLTEHTYTRKLEEEFSSFLNVKHCSMVPNGTIGLIIALRACGIEAGSRVACPAMTMIAPAYAISMLGAKPVFVDVDESGCLDIYNLEEEVDAILYVSANGRKGNIKDVKDYCEYREIPLIEDACQSLGSDNLGTIGDIGVYSLSPHKIISTGQGGLIVTNSDDLGKRVRQLKDFGRLEGGSDQHYEFGINAKFTDLQAVIGLEQIKYLKDRLSVKELIYEHYRSHLKDIMLDHFNTPWMVDIYVDSNTDLAMHLANEGIKTRLMYPVIPHQRVYRQYGNYPVAQRFASRGLWLPSSLDLTGKEIDEICEKVKEFLGKGI